MSGHNKWSKVKRPKDALDAKRGKLFNKLAKEITLATKTGSGSPDGNPHLRPTVHTAQTGALPHDNIVRAIKPGTTSHDQLHVVGDSLKWGAGLEPNSMKLTYLPENAVPAVEEAAAVQSLRLSDTLEENDDVQHVHANDVISEEHLVKIGG